MSPWPQRPLTDVARLVRGTEPGRANYSDSPSNGIRFLRVGDVTGTTDKSIYATSQKLTRVEPDDVVITLDGSPGVVATGFHGAISAGIRRVDLLAGSPVSRDWLRFMLMSPTVQATIRRHATGVTILHASSAVAHIRIPVPPRAEQDRRSRELHEAESLLKLRETATRRLEAVTDALLEAELARTAAVTTSEVALESLCSKIVDCPHSTPKYAEGKTPYPCLRSSDIQLGELDFTTTKYVERPEYQTRVQRLVPQTTDVVFCREGARLGNAALIPEGTTACLGQRIMLLRADPAVALPEFVWGALLSNGVQRQVAQHTTGAASPHINIRDIRAIRVPLPDLGVQERYAQKMRALSALRGRQERQRARLVELFDGLLHRASVDQS